jgi:hypothetical protein
LNDGGLTHCGLEYGRFRIVSNQRSSVRSFPKRSYCKRCLRKFQRSHPGKVWEGNERYEGVPKEGPAVV